MNQQTDMSDMEQNKEVTNRMIAEFMEIPFREITYPNGTTCYEIDKDFFGIKNWTSVRYHLDLDWLHPVVQKIGKEKVFLNHYKFLHFDEQTPSIFDDISVIYDWVVKVIEWVNKNKP